MNAVVESVAGTAFGDLALWQAMLDRSGELFAEMADGSRIGIVSRTASGILPGKHLEGVRATAEVPMLAWQVDGGAMSVRMERFAGITATRVDLLLVADDEALATLLGDLDNITLTAIKRQIRGGGIMFFVFRNKAQLQDAGYEDFLDSLGLAFLGACR